MSKITLEMLLGTLTKGAIWLIVIIPIASVLLQMFINLVYWVAKGVFDAGKEVGNIIITMAGDDLRRIGVYCETGSRWCKGAVKRNYIDNEIIDLPYKKVENIRCADIRVVSREKDTAGIVSDELLVSGLLYECKVKAVYTEITNDDGKVVKGKANYVITDLKRKEGILWIDEKTQE